MLYIIDSYAWVEYFIGSKKGEVLRKLFSYESNEFITVECCLAEIKSWSLRNEQDFDKLFKIVRANSTIVSLNEHNWIHAGEERFHQRKTQNDFGLIDAVILIKQKEYSCHVVTGDKHFKNMKL
ncbi:PIN domain-containing protein [Candidatus Woesearchaeota archaeon]|nr:PIN domain-containing protein [Candidatus Woesearchaeota archaeon]